MRSFSFRAYSYGAHFHFTPSPMTHIFVPCIRRILWWSWWKRSSDSAHSLYTLIFILRLLLGRTFSFHFFSYDAHFPSAPSPTAHIFIPRFLLYAYILLFERRNKFLPACLSHNTLEGGGMCFLKLFNWYNRFMEKYIQLRVCISAITTTLLVFEKNKFCCSLRNIVK